MMPRCRPENQILAKNMAAAVHHALAGLPDTAGPAVGEEGCRRDVNTFSEELLFGAEGTFFHVGSARPR